MYKTPKIRLLFLPILAFLLLFQCSKVEENLVTNDFETSQLQSVQDVFIGFLNQGGSRLTGRVSEDNQEFVSVNLNDISLEPLTNSNAMLTVVPAILSATPSTFTRAIALDYGGKTHTAILSLIPNNSNHSNGFSGYSITYKLSGEIINAYRIEADTIVAKLQTSNISITDSPISDTSGLRIVDGCDCDTSPLPDCCFEEQLLDEVVIIANTGGIPAEHLFEPSEHEGIDLDAQEPVSLLVGGGGSLWLDCDPGYERDNQGNCVIPEEEECGEGFALNEEGVCVEEVGVSCKSFNFTNTTPLWQESAVRNIGFKIVLLDNKGFSLRADIGFFPILFGLPSNFTVGGNLSADSAAELSALILQGTIRQMTQTYARTNTSEAVIRTAFREALIENYKSFTVGGGRVQFNYSGVLPTSEYITTGPFEGSGGCD